MSNISDFLIFFILFLVLPSNFITSGVKEIKIIPCINFKCNAIFNFVDEYSCC